MFNHMTPVFRRLQWLVVQRVPTLAKQTRLVSLHAHQWRGVMSQVTTIAGGVGAGGGAGAGPQASTATTSTGSAAAAASKAPQCVLVVNGTVTQYSCDLPSFVRAGPEGVYTSARTVGLTSVFQFQHHVRRLGECHNTTCCMHACSLADTPNTHTHTTVEATYSGVCKGHCKCHEGAATF